MRGVAQVLVAAPVPVVARVSVVMPGAGGLVVWAVCAVLAGVAVGGG